MRAIVHLSDLHFGDADPALVAPLIASVRACAPDLVAVSGDLTQRARRAQFRAARAFLDRLAAPAIVVPGNHDVPLYSVVARFLHPLASYARAFGTDLEPLFADDEIAVLGINTARSLTFKGGRINEEQVARARGRLCALPAHVLKIAVTHHPFDLPESANARELVGRVAMATRGLAACGVRIILSGHLHTGRVGTTLARFAIEGHSALVVHAGTALSRRRRGEANAFNVVRTAREGVAVEQHVWSEPENAFICKTLQDFRFQDGHWLGAAG
jgi:3',5'-cyclic AMP phosphodiesterase CpdA